MTSDSITFYGAAETVTGSKHLIRSRAGQVLLDCGMFQGYKEHRLKNWKVPPFDSEKINSVILSHAHIDHSGYLPRLMKHHFRGKIFSSSATAELLKVLLLDAAGIQYEEARFANKKGYSKHKPALPLFTEEDVFLALDHLKHYPYGKEFKAAPGIKARLHRAGHILGSSIIEVLIGENNPKKVVFTGDLGRWDQPILRDPEFVEGTDVLLLESTYGNRLHTPAPIEALAQALQETFDQKGVLIIPSFAVGRTQEIIWMIRQLEDEGKVPVMKVVLDSPMAIDVTHIYCTHQEEHDEAMARLANKEASPLQTQKFAFIRAPKDSKRLNDLSGPLVIIASSGMMTGGRVLHHLIRRLNEPKTTVLLVGYQVPGTRGHLLQEGAKSLKILGQKIEVKANVVKIDGLSAHADQNEILKWLKGFKQPPKQTFLVHGEPDSSAALKEKIQTELGWNVDTAKENQTVEF